MAISTLIFGPTGGVAAYAVQYAASKGAHVGLAMRDPSKNIDSLSAEQESSGNFTRVKADLTDPASVAEAAKATSAHSAFIYLIHGPNLTPPESIQALKDAGVRHIVFLSSYSTKDPIENHDEEDVIPYRHAQVEMSLHRIYGEGNYTALRPAYFASNMLRFAPAIKTGVVKEFHPENKIDLITPQDIGEVAGSLLVRELGPLPRAVYLTGPQHLPLEEAVRTIGRLTGRDVKVEHLEKEPAYNHYVENLKFPPPLARYFVNALDKWHSKGGLLNDGNYEVGNRNVKELLGRDGIPFEQWANENKAAFV